MPNCIPIETVTPSLSNINSVSLANQTVNSMAAIPFDSNRVVNGRAITHTIGTREFNLLRPGTYNVTFTTSAMAADDSSESILSVGLATCNIVSPGTVVSSRVVSSNDIVNLSTQGLFEVERCTILTVKNTGDITTIYINPNITIVKII